MTIGIDFGTTKTIVSWINPKTGVAETMKCFENSDVVQTAIYVQESGEIVVGDQALLLGAIDPRGYYESFKLRLGSGDQLLARKIKGRRTTSAYDLTVCFLQYVKSSCIKFFEKDHSIDAVAMTIPVGFTISQEQALREAAKEAGLGDVYVVREPVAAAIAFSRASTIHFDRALVVDWGGGTVDLALVDGRSGKINADANYQVGSCLVGGSELDRLFINSVIAKIAENPLAKIPDPLCGEPEDRCEAQDLAQRRYELTTSILRDKIRLDSAESVVCYPRGCGGVLQCSLEVSRVDYLHAVGGCIHQVGEMINDLVARIPESQKPTKLLLTGGTCRSPVICETLERLTGLPSHEWKNYSREAVSLGAVYFISQKSQNIRHNGDCDETSIVDKKPCGDQFSSLCECGSPRIEACEDDCTVYAWTCANCGAISRSFYCPDKCQSCKDDASVFDKILLRDQGVDFVINRITGIEHKTEGRSYTAVATVLKGVLFVGQSLDTVNGIDGNMGHVERIVRSLEVKWIKGRPVQEPDEILHVASAGDRVTIGIDGQPLTSKQLKNGDILKNVKGTRSISDREVIFRSCSFYRQCQDCPLYHKDECMNESPYWRIFSKEMQEKFHCDASLITPKSKWEEVARDSSELDLEYWFKNDSVRDVAKLFILNSDLGILGWGYFKLRLKHIDECEISDFVDAILYEFEVLELNPDVHTIGDLYDYARDLIEHFKIKDRKLQTIREMRISSHQ